MSEGSNHSAARRHVRDAADARHVASLSWHLQRAMVIGSAWFGLLGGVYLVAPPLEPGRPIAILNLAVAAGCALIGFLDFRLEGRYARVLVYLAATIVAVCPLGLLGLSRAPDQTVVVIVCMMAGAGVVPNSAASTYFTTLLVVGWLVLRPPMTRDEDLHWFINLGVAAVASVLIALTRERFVRTIVTLAQQGEEARQQLLVQTRELADARDAAVQSANAKGRFLANMSHEIRTPLNGIVGMLSLLRRTPLDEAQTDHLTEVVRSSELLMTIVNDILDVSKIEAGAVELEVVAFDIAQLAEEVASAHAATALQRGLELIADVDANLPKQVLGDPLRVRQILTNLVSNAIKFTSKGEVVVAVRLVDARNDGRVRLRLAVTDTGVGIADEKLASIFNPFSQADSSTTREFGGTGLGLSICRQLVELMDSVLKVTSAPGRGSSFSFELVLQEEDLLTTRGLKVNSRLWQSRVLVIDASERMRLTLQSQLGAWGVETALARSPDEAVAFARGCAQRDESPFDVAIVDVTTLGQPVVRAAQVLGAALAPLGCVMIAMGSSLGELRQQLSTCGFATDLPKPIHRNRLLDALNIALDAEPIVPTVGASESPPSRAVTAGAGDVALNGHKVLVVEDNATNQRVAIAQLHALGYASDLAVDGRDAVKLLANPDHGYWCVLMDGQMPIMDGYEATREVRAIEGRAGRARVPILALTANVMPGDRERAIESGMDGYLAKPFTLSQLEVALQDCWTIPRGGLTSRAMEPADPQDWRETLDAEIVGQLQMLESVSPGFFAQVAQTYLATSQDNMGELLSAAKAGDLPTMQRRAHALVGSSRQVGAMRVGSLCAAIEHAAALADVAAEISELRSAVQRAQRALMSAVDSQA